MSAVIREFLTVLAETRHVFGAVAPVLLLHV